MAGVFLSHSSGDKLFVRKLAIDLSSEGFPVWFDNWELDAGDQLHRAIEEGIDDSTFLVLVVSKNSLKSEWVERELARGLERERQTGRKFIIPIRIDPCSVPIGVANRLYANFVDSPYQAALEALVKVLSQAGAAEAKVDPKHRIVPLVFSKGVHLELFVLEASLRHLPLQHEFDLVQFVLGPDEDYARLRLALQKNVDEVTTWQEYTPDVERYIRNAYKQVRFWEAGLLSGMKLLLENLRPGGFRTPAYWFCRVIRAELLSILWGSQRKASGNLLEYGKDVVTMSSMCSAATFFEVNSVDRVQCFPHGSAGYFGAWIDAESQTAHDLHDFIGSPEPLNGVCSPMTIEKFLIPQMLYSNLLTPRDPVSFDFRDWMIGLA